MQSIPTPTEFLLTPSQSTRKRLTAWLLQGGVFLLTALVIVWSFWGLGFDFTHFGTGIQVSASYVAQMFPRSHADWRYDLSLRHSLLDPLQATIQMAVAGTFLGAVLAFPVSFLAARTGSLPLFFSGLVKTYLNISRSVPTLVYALLAVAAVGLGPSAGALAIALATFASLAKLYAEALESVSPGPVEAVRAVGGGPAQIFFYGMLPQVLPLYLSTTLFTLEYNIKDSFIVGLVGAGGLGYELSDDFRLFKWLDAGVIILLLILLVNAVDYLSYRTRRVFS
jgi:phosphonate transport system permease protein